MDFAFFVRNGIKKHILEKFVQIESDASRNYLPHQPASIKPDISAVTPEEASDMLGLLEKKSRRCARLGNVAWGSVLTASMPTMLAYFHLVAERPETAIICAAIGTGIIAVGIYILGKTEEKKRVLDSEIGYLKDGKIKGPQASIKSRPRAA